MKDNEDISIGDLNKQVSSSKMSNKKEIASTLMLPLNKGRTTTRAALELDDAPNVDNDARKNQERDAQRLLCYSSTNKARLNDFKCCRSTYKVGNCTVLFPSLYARTGFGIVGKICYMHDSTLGSNV